VPEGLETLSVAQNEKLLEYDSTDELRYRLKHAEGAIKATWAEGEKDIPLVGAGRNYLIFKMRKEWKGLGRLVQCPSTGYYLVIVPQEWKRDEEVSGTAPDEPESVQLDGYKAHFFYQKENTVIGFITRNGERIRVESGGPRFQLVGREIGDVSEDMGPLFGERPPNIGMIAEQGWSDVGVVVVGEEGGGQNRWRMQFVPQVGAEEQKLPEEIAERRGGWYFVRIYDNNDNLLESMDFRFLGGLKDIRIESSDCLPGPNGHDNVIVQFLHQTSCEVELIDENARYALEIRRESGQTIVAIPPKPACDKTHWILRGAKPGETVVVKVPADQPRPLKQKQQEVQKFILKEEKIHLLQANVKCQRGKRQGKGFSRKEVTKAGIAIEDVKHLHIPYDKRRRTSHLWNIEDLKYIIER